MSMLGAQEALSESHAGEWELVGRDMIRTKRTADGGGMIVAQFWTSPTPEHAAMMVAAPQVLAALKALDAYWTEDFPGGPDGPRTVMNGLGVIADDTIAIWKEVRAAIAAAEATHA